MTKHTALIFLQKTIRAKRDTKKAKILQRFFKTGKGEYGEGDKFLGVSVPEVRKISAKVSDPSVRLRRTPPPDEGEEAMIRQLLSLADIKVLLRSPFHEERQVALFILVRWFKNGNEASRRKIYEMYLANTRFINNWDLVDCSAGHIVGKYLEGKEKTALTKLARSKKLWERRIAMIATLHFIVNGSSKDALKIANILVHDTHDLIHKAVGWMLREVGKRCSMHDLEKFLRRHSKTMPRTMLRYAIEKMPEKKRKEYLS